MKENIVFFFSDQQRFDTLGCNGQKLPVTPNIDQLAAEGVNFVNTFTAQPVCGPARACLQTGRYPTETGCFKNSISLPLNTPTLARYMKGAGYDVAYVGKWHLASDEHTNHYETTPVPLERRGGYTNYWMASDILEFTSHGYDGYVYDKDNNKVEFKGYRADCLTDYAIDYIKNYEEQKPFFLFVSHIEPHHQNDRNSYEGPDGAKERWKDFERPADLTPGKGDWEEFYPDYLGCCNALDRNLGRIIETLKEKGIYDNTMIVYASDHGCHFKNHTDIAANGYDDYKRNSFENTIHIPLVIKGCDFKGGYQEKRLISLIDLPKTIMTAAGCEIESSIQGWAIQGIREQNWRDDVYIQISESYVGRAVRNDRYKYVIHAPEQDPSRCAMTARYQEKYLFDLEHDPLERNNLIHDKNYGKVKESMKQRMIHYAAAAGEGTIEIVSSEMG